MIFPQNLHYPAVFKPIGIFIVLFPAQDATPPPDGYYWSYAFLTQDVLPAVTFWLILILLIIFLPSYRIKT